MNTQRRDEQPETAKEQLERERQVDQESRIDRHADKIKQEQRDKKYPTRKD